MQISAHPCSPHRGRSPSSPGTIAGESCPSFFQQDAKQPTKFKAASASGYLVPCTGEGGSLEDIEALSIALDIGATYEQLSESVNIYLRCQARGSGEHSAPQAAAQSAKDIERALHKRQGACLFVCNVP